VEERKEGGDPKAGRRELVVGETRNMIGGRGRGVAQRGILDREFKRDRREKVD